MSQISTEKLDQLFEAKTSTIALDLKLNLKRLLTESQLAPDEAALTLLATSTSAEHSVLQSYAREQLQSLGVSPDLIVEAAESAAIMGMLNVYYRSKHMIGKDDEYRSAGLRMTALAKPAMGKEKFEMLAFAVSCINGCHVCVQSHEKALRSHGLTADKIHDLVRLAAVVKGLSALG